MNEQTSTDIIQQSAKELLAERIRKAKEGVIEAQKRERERTFEEERQFLIKNYKKTLECFAYEWFHIRTDDLTPGEKEEIGKMIHKRVWRQLAGYGLLNAGAVCVAFVTGSFATALTSVGILFGFFGLLTVPTCLLASIIKVYKIHNGYGYSSSFRFANHIHFLLSRKYALDNARINENEPAKISARY